MRSNNGFMLNLQLILFSLKTKKNNHTIYQSTVNRLAFFYLHDTSQKSFQK